MQSAPAREVWGHTTPRKILDFRPLTSFLVQSYPIGVCVSIITVLCGMCARSSPAESISASHIAPAQEQSGSGSRDKIHHQARVVHVQPVQYYKCTPAIINLHPTDIFPTDINFPFLPLSHKSHQNPLHTLILPLCDNCTQDIVCSLNASRTTSESQLSCACAGITRG